MKERKTVAVLPLARPTFDVEFAQEKLNAMLAQLDSQHVDLIGSRELLFDGAATLRALDEITHHAPDLILILQVTFTDAVMAVEIANRFSSPIAIWSIPEPRIGGRLRLNSFCGLNLAAHALTKTDREIGYLFAEPDASCAAALAELLAGKRTTAPAKRNHVQLETENAKRTISAVAGSRIGRIGEHPDGFETCAYKDDALKDLADVSVAPIDLSTLFQRADAVPEADEAETRALAESQISGLEEVDQDQLGKSLRLKNALDGLRSEGAFDAFAIRCWPETFTEYGGAVCGPVSMMGEARVPCACEADVYGSLTQLYLQELTGTAPFLVDLVDIDFGDDTGVVWHCGQAPISMRGNAAAATIHTNRKMPLLYEFTLKPGPVTFMRVSQARGETCIIMATGEMLDRPMAYTGTSGVVKFAAPASELLPKIMDAGLEHHMALVYGDWREDVRGLAAGLKLPLVEL